VFSDIYANAAQLLKSDNPLLVTGKLEKGEKGAKILVQGHKEGASEWQLKQRGPAGDIRLLQDVRAQTTKKVCFTIRADEMPTGRLNSLKEIIERHHGTIPASIHFIFPEQRLATLQLPENMNVGASDDLRLEVERLFGYNVATFE
jgi:DNA polymerase-3 subunit alpha